MKRTDDDNYANKVSNIHDELQQDLRGLHQAGPVKKRRVEKDAAPVKRTKTPRKAPARLQSSKSESEDLVPAREERKRLDADRERCLNIKDTAGCTKSNCTWSKRLGCMAPKDAQHLRDLDLEVDTAKHRYRATSNKKERKTLKQDYRNTKKKRKVNLQIQKKLRRLT